MWNSDKTLQALAKHVHSQLLPSDIDEDDEDSEGHRVSEQLPSCCVESAITRVAIRVNYGAESVPNQAKVSAHLCIWRWEVNERNFHWLPKASRDKLRNRLYERHKVCTFNFLARYQSECSQVRDEVAVLLCTSLEPGNVTIPSSFIPQIDQDTPSTTTDQPELLETHLTEVGTAVCGFPEGPLFPQSDAEAISGTGEAKQNHEQETVQGESMLRATIIPFP